MTTLTSLLRTEVRRLAAAEVRKVRSRLRRIHKQVKALSQVSRRHKRSLASVERKVHGLRDRLRGHAPASRPLRGPRVAPRAIRALRRRLKLTRLAFADLVGVSPGSIFGWETGRTVPRGGSRARLVKLRASKSMPIRQVRAVARRSRRHRRRARG